MSELTPIKSVAFVYLEIIAFLSKQINRISEEMTGLTL
jgi:hypothetical protein